MTTTTTQIHAFGGTYRQRLHSGFLEFDEACCMCGKQVRAGKDGKRTYVYLLNDSRVALPGMERSDDDLMMYPIGSDCARKHRLKALGAELARM